MAATRLWKSTRAADWEAQWKRYDTVIASLQERVVINYYSVVPRESTDAACVGGCRSSVSCNLDHDDDATPLLHMSTSQKDKLVALDAWFQHELPTVLHARDPAPFLTQQELVHLMEWKLKKGKWRPQLMKFVENLSDAAVQAASTAALRTLATDDSAQALKTATQALTELKGVGPATASAVLAAYDNRAPFMGDEALDAIAHVIGARKYTLPHYLDFVAQLTTKAAWLQKESDDDGNSDKWTPQRVQLCLFATAYDKETVVATPATKASKAKAPVATTKRRAAVEATRKQPTRASSSRQRNATKQTSDSDVSSSDAASDDSRRKKRRRT